ncbi:LIM domain and actin-binding protein 1 isoform X2 [Drosophila kikkawai]|nr:LIM domain and actin-binding protein 1 isoform X1 [Drosophila kikkawai]XP_017022588.1 LIM domain and actin-binding protein 1 isoform X1 [Drosophila kikkawai]XP_041632663.1 LIM domain and actin-binding protein 1 isoform X1 [Drosophila kikkawai]XP_041632664.1 LIM domain and actin-binding protein 1 isoform X1 [Drosophila kikkawai]
MDSTKGKKIKSKKIRSTENHDKQNINMKKSFSKFDDLQRRSLLHTSIAEQHLDNCNQCQKSVYKMEEVILQLKTGTKIFHKTCLRCKECSKQLKLENFHAHDGYLYCHMHFKLIFAPKIVYEEIKPRKPELIIRENQPMELPPDVARASDKPNLGLDELQQLNVRSRFEMFETGASSQNNNHSQDNRQETPITHGKSIRSTLSKLQKLGISNLKSEQIEEINEIKVLIKDDNSNDDDSDDCSRMILTEKERPLGLGEAINDIKTKFENGEMVTKEERREERKQEIQEIRSRLFMGKQAKIKEMYQQAVAESEQGLTSVGKTPEIKLTTAPQSIKDRFENGEAFRNSIKLQLKEVIEDAEVFESAISKDSRNIFMQMDANSASNLVSSRSSISNNPPVKLIQSNKKNIDMDRNIIKSDAKPEYLTVATEELTERFKFFEQFRPVENKKHIFRITPPREGVVRIDTDTDTDILSSTKKTSIAEDILMKTKTTSTILNKFREMENFKILEKNDKIKQAKPMKCFTPPPEAENFTNNKSDSEDEDIFSEDEETNTNEDSDDDKGSESENVRKSCNQDQALQEAKNAARAKQLRAKFEKWQDNEIQRELKEDREDVYSQLISSDSIESAKIIRERFENMKINGEMKKSVPRPQINRFV